jgi:hypothetical protein
LLYLNINWEVEDIDKIILISNLFSLLKSWGLFGLIKLLYSAHWNRLKKDMSSTAAPFFLTLAMPS